MKIKQTDKECLDELEDIIKKARVDSWSYQDHDSDSVFDKGWYSNVVNNGGDTIAHKCRNEHAVLICFLVNNSERLISIARKGESNE